MDQWERIVSVEKDLIEANEELGFKPGPGLDCDLKDLINWYKENKDWWHSIKSGEYKNYYERMYKDREV